MNYVKDTDDNERFAIVFQNLTASPHFNPSEYRILVACIGVDNIKPEDGKPFTHSIPSLMKMTALSHSTTSRCLKRLLKEKIFKVYGYLISYKKKYPVYTFNYDVLKDLIPTNVKMTIVGTNEITGSNDVDVPAIVKSNVKMTFNNVRRSNIVEGTLLEAVQSGDGTAKTKCSVISQDLIKTPAITGRVFEPVATSALALKVPLEIGLSHSARRSEYVVKELNKRYNFSFVKEGATGSEWKGHSVCAYDTKHKLILITCDDLEYLSRPYIQIICNDFAKDDYDLVAWVANLQVVVPLGLTKGED